MKKLRYAMFTTPEVDKCSECHCCCFFIREAARKKLRSFFNGPATKAFPPPLELSGHNFFLQFFFELKKRSFFLVAKPHPPLLATKK